MCTQGTNLYRYSLAQDIMFHTSDLEGNCVVTI
jgi:hypothetical protein